MAGAHPSSHARIAVVTKEWHSAFLLVHEKGTDHCRPRSRLLRPAHTTPDEHAFATEMLRAGASLPAVKELLGHRTIEMALRYVQVSQIDLQREYHQARKKILSLHVIPKLQPAAGEGLQALQELLTEARHRIEMWCRRLTNEKASRNLARLTNRLSKIAAELNRVDEQEK